MPEPAQILLEPPPVLPGRKGMILCLGSFWPPSMGNLSSICIWKRKSERGEESQGFTGRTQGEETEQAQRSPTAPSFGRKGREMQTLLCFPWGMDLMCLPGFLQLLGPQGTEMGLAASVGALCLNNSAFMEALETTCPGSVLSPLQPCTCCGYTFFHSDLKDWDQLLRFGAEGTDRRRCLPLHFEKKLKTPPKTTGKAGRALRVKRGELRSRMAPSTAGLCSQLLLQTIGRSL